MPYYGDFARRLNGRMMSFRNNFICMTGITTGRRSRFQIRADALTAAKTGCQITAVATNWEIQSICIALPFAGDRILLTQEAVNLVSRLIYLIKTVG